MSIVKSAVMYFAVVCVFLLKVNPNFILIADLINVVTVVARCRLNSLCSIS